MINYEELPYPNFVFPDTHPSRLAAAGWLFGLAPKTSNNARVLEIGCGAGLNTLAHAASLPSSTFIAIDPSQTQIESAINLQAQSRIKNVDFIVSTIEAFDHKQIPFDYIICHGVFSWVSTSTQHEILLRCKKLLSDHGIAYISYNSLPGWHLQRIFRELLLYNSEESGSHTAEQAKSVLRICKTLFPKNFQNYAATHIEHLLESEDSYLLHEYLTDNNQAFYFKDFLELLSQHGLTYLAESDLGSMIPREFDPETQAELQKLSNNKQSSLEQYCDFIRLRQFRKTLVVKDSAKINRNIDWDKFKDLFIACRMSHLSKVYQSKDCTSDPMVNKLKQSFPSYKKVSDITGNDLNSSEVLFQSVALDDLELRDVAPAIFCEQQGEYRVSTLAATLAKNSLRVANLRSENVEISEMLQSALIRNNELSGSEFEEAKRLGILEAI